MFSEALNDFDEAVKLDPKNAEVYYNRGNVYLHNEDFDKAQADFDAAISLDETNPKSYHAKGLCYQAQCENIAKQSGPRNMDDESEMCQNAILFFGEALRLDNGYLSSMFHQGLMFRRKADFTNALKMFTRVMQKLPDDKTVFIERGLVYKDMGNHEHAIYDFDKAIDLDPNSFLALFHRGMCKYKLNRIEDAITDLKSSYDKDNNFEIPGINDGLGLCYLKMKNYEESKERLDECLKQEPDNIEFLMHRADLFFDQGLYESSIEDLNLALKQDEDDPQILYKLGLVYFSFKKYKKCVKTMK